jgi:acyl-CoA hydrolase
LLHFVAIDKNLQPAQGLVPAVELTREDDIRHHLIAKKERELQKSRGCERERLQKTDLSAEALEDPINKSKIQHRTIASTRIESNRLFFPSHLNMNKTIFGGELMRWMEANAVHCGRVLTGNRNVVSLAMHSVEFKSPVFLTDWLTLTAEVVYVRNTTCEVDVVVVAERKGKTVPVTSSSFILVQLDDIGQAAAISIGIKLEGTSDEERLKYAAAKMRYQYCRTNRQKIRMADVEEMEATVV